MIPMIWIQVFCGGFHTTSCPVGPAFVSYDGIKPFQSMRQRMRTLLCVNALRLSELRERPS